jgi:O-antigen/teichoic acid export membrane protein
MFKVLISIIRKPIESSHILQKILFNTSWLFLDKIIKLFVGILASVIVARYLGPENFGILSYALSITTFLGTFVYLGLSGIVVRDIVKHPYQQEIIFGTTFGLKFAGSTIAYLVILFIAFQSYKIDSIEYWILIILGFNFFLGPFQVIDYYFQAQIESKYTVFAGSISYILSNLLKILFSIIQISILYFAFAYLLETFIATVLIIIFFHYNKQSIFKWKFNISKAKELLSQSWILIISQFLAMTNLKIDQVMLRWLKGLNEVGIYSVAVTFSETWYFIPTIIVSSLYPFIIAQEQQNRLLYELNLQKIFDILFLFGFTISIIVTIISTPLIYWLYGEPFREAALILSIHIWAGIFIFMRALFSRWIIIEGLLVLSLYSQGLGAIINVLLNYHLIPHYGGYGAAISTLVSYATSSYFVLFLSPKTLPVAKMMTKSFILPIRLYQKRGKIWA